MFQFIYLVKIDHYWLGILHEVNISPPPSLAKLIFLNSATNQIKSKIEKHNVSFDVSFNVSFDIFVAIRHQYSRKLSSAWIKVKIFQLHMDPYSFFGSDFHICVAQNQITFEDQSLIIEIKNICIDQ